MVTFPSLNAKVQLDVLDDFESEAKEVTSLNPWLTYGAPLHRAREIGVRRSILGLLDRRRLTKLELMDFLRLLFRHELEELGGGVGGEGVGGEAEMPRGGGGEMVRLPDPELDWVGFERVVQTAVERAGDTWDVRRNCFAPWVDMDTIRYLYGGGGFENNGGRREGGNEGKDVGRTGAGSRIDIGVRIGNETGESRRVGRSLSPPRRTRSGEGGAARALSNPGRRERQRRVSDGSSSMSPSILSLASSLGHSGLQGSMSLRAPWHTEQTSAPPANAGTAFTDTVPRASSPRAGSRSGSPPSSTASTTSRRRGTFFGTCKWHFTPSTRPALRTHGIRHSNFLD